VAAQCASCGLRVLALVEQAVDRRAGAGDVGAEGARRENRVRHRRAREVVRGQPGEIPRPLHLGEPVEKQLTALGEAGCTVAHVEGRVDVGRRGLRGVPREQDENPEVLRQVELLELASVATAELRAVREEERDVGTDPGCDPEQLLARDRLRERVV